MLKNVLLLCLFISLFVCLFQKFEWEDFSACWTYFIRGKSSRRVFELSFNWCIFVEFFLVVNQCFCNIDFIWLFQWKWFNVSVVLLDIRFCFTSIIDSENLASRLTMAIHWIVSVYCSRIKLDDLKEPEKIWLAKAASIWCILGDIRL